MLAAAIAAGCAKREPPSGGPPDLEPPRLIRSVPDSGRAGVATHARIMLTFSEPMEPRATAEAVQISPPVPIRQRRWSGRMLALTLGDTLRASHTYTVFVGTTARDRHGNDLSAGAAVVFSTGAAFPRGRIGGRIEARGFAGPGTYLWCYDAGRVGVPDSTARDFDALGIADEEGHFRVDGLTVPGRYRLWAFADLNQNRSYEPDRDLLAPVDTTLELTAESPVVDSMRVRLVNPRALGRLEGVVLDSLRDSLGVIRVLAVGEIDSTLRVLADPERNGRFELSLRAGPWLLRVFQDEDRNGDWAPGREPAGDPLRVTVEAAGQVSDLRLVLRGRGGGP